MQGKKKNVKAKRVSKQTCKQRNMQGKKQTHMHENKPEANTTPTPKLMVHGLIT